MNPPITHPDDAPDRDRPSVAERVGRVLRFPARWATLCVWGVLLALIAGLWLRSAWRDDTLTLNVKGVALTLGSSRGTVFTGYTEISSQTLDFNHHSTSHRLHLWWRPQILHAHRGVVFMLPLWIPLTLLLGLLSYQLMRRRFLLRGLAAPAFPAAKPLGAPRQPAP